MIYVNVFIMQGLLASMEQYLQGLFHLAHDPSADVRKLVWHSFVLPVNTAYNGLLPVRIFW